MRPVKRPRREPDLSFARPVDGSMVEVWTTKHQWRSRDRELDGTTYFRPLVFIAGSFYDHIPRRCVSAQAALDYVTTAFRGPKS